MFDFSSFVPNLCGGGSTSPGSPEVTALEGQELYLHFFHEQLRSAQLGEYAAQEEARYSNTPQSFGQKYFNLEVMMTSFMDYPIYFDIGWTITTSLRHISIARKLTVPCQVDEEEPNR
jgi:hypothetical protein